MYGRSLDRQLEEQRQKERSRPAPPTEEELEEELDRPAFVPLELQKSVFDGAAKTGGINTAPSVFEGRRIFGAGE